MPLASKPGAPRPEGKQDPLKTNLGVKRGPYSSKPMRPEAHLHPHDTGKSKPVYAVKRSRYGL